MLRIVVVAFVLALAAPAAAQGGGRATVAALGASQTYGMGVARSQAFPAQLERMLRAEGYPVRVLNLGRNGDTTGGMLGRLGSVPRDARIVILQPGGNDWRQGRLGERQGNVEAIEAQLRSRGVQVILVENNVFGPLERGPDGQHLSPAGHQALARSLVPEVKEALASR